MPMTIEKLGTIVAKNHEEQMKVSHAIEIHLAQLNGTSQQNTEDIVVLTKALSELPCREHSDAITRLKTISELQPSPREAGRAEATQEQHKVNWGRIAGLGVGLVGSFLAGAVAFAIASGGAP